MDPTCEIPRGRHLAPHEFPDPALDVAPSPGAGPQTAVLAGGCFWCVEAVLKEIDGVLEVISGYSGGSAETADYDAVCSGRTGHAEAVEVRFDPVAGELRPVAEGVLLGGPRSHPAQPPGRGPGNAVPLRDLLPRTRSRSGWPRPTSGSSTRPAPTTRRSSPRWRPWRRFYEAEAYHQDYASRHPMQPYILFTCGPQGGQAAQALRGPAEGLRNA